MTGKFLDPVRNDANESRNSMMDLWKESLRRSAEHRMTVTPKDMIGQNADLLRRIRNGQVECPTCAERQYKDKSNDGGVSFQAPKGLSDSTAALAVISHEHEHVANEMANAKKGAREQHGEPIVKSNVTLQKAVCPLCGKTHIVCGTTSTQAYAAPLLGSVMDRHREFDRIFSPYQTLNAKA